MTDWNDVICVDSWTHDETAYERGYYPEGTRVKSVYFSPEDVGQLPLRPSHRYMLKQSRRFAPWQFWIEIIAHRIGQVMTVPVPPAYVGLSTKEESEQNVWGALIEWFYTDEESYIGGGRLIAPLIPDFDHEAGKQHNLQTVLSIPGLTNVPNPAENRRILVTHWAAVLLFDAVIGNTDRHQENWGLVGPRSLLDNQKRIFNVRLSPAFDNGTALSYEQPEEHFSRFEDEKYALRYLTRPRRAKHHMKWDLQDDASMNFYDFMARFVREFPDTKPMMLNRLAFSESDVRDRLSPLLAIPVDAEWRLTNRRLDFMLLLLMKRKALVEEALRRA